MAKGKRKGPPDDPLGDIADAEKALGAAIAEVRTVTENTTSSLKAAGSYLDANRSQLRRILVAVGLLGPAFLLGDQIASWIA